MKSLKDLRILFADDELYSMRPTIDALEAKGALVDVCREGTEVLLFLERNQKRLPELIILDLMMAPGTDISTPDEGRSTGIEVYKHIRKMHSPHLPVVISTVVTDEAMLTLFGADRRVAVVRKPYPFEDLLRAIDKLI